jgi:hypothetical protein
MSILKRAYRETVARTAMAGAVSGLALTAAAAAATQAAAIPVAVYVTSAGATASMSDPNQDNRDTVKDLREALQEKRATTVVRLVDRREEAVMVLVVENREQGQVDVRRYRELVVRVTLHWTDGDGAHTAALSGTGTGGVMGTGGAWKRAAGQVAKQVTAWVTENRARLADRPERSRP